jgi:hypothetical protein
MTIEDDIERVQRATDKLVGPQKVWVLHLSGDHGPEIHLFTSQALGLQHAHGDMQNFVDAALESEKWLKELKDTKYVQVDGRYKYELEEREVRSS